MIPSVAQKTRKSMSNSQPNQKKSFKGLSTEQYHKNEAALSNRSISALSKYEITDKLLLKGQNFNGKSEKRNSSFQNSFNDLEKDKRLCEQQEESEIIFVDYQIRIQNHQEIHKTPLTVPVSNQKLQLDEKFEIPNIQGHELLHLHQMVQQENQVIGNDKQPYYSERFQEEQVFKGEQSIHDFSFRMNDFNYGFDLNLNNLSEQIPNPFEFIKDQQQDIQDKNIDKDLGLMDYQEAPEQSERGLVKYLADPEDIFAGLELAPPKKSSRKLNKKQKTKTPEFVLESQQYLSGPIMVFQDRYHHQKTRYYTEEDRLYNDRMNQIIAKNLNQQYSAGKIKKSAQEQLQKFLCEEQIGSKQYYIDKIKTETLCASDKRQKEILENIYKQKEQDYSQFDVYHHQSTIFQVRNPKQQGQRNRIQKNRRLGFAILLMIQIFNKQDRKATVSDFAQLILKHYEPFLQQKNIQYKTLKRRVYDCISVLIGIKMVVKNKIFIDYQKQKLKLYQKWRVSQILKVKMKKAKQIKQMSIQNLKKKIRAIKKQNQIRILLKDRNYNNSQTECQNRIQYQTMIVLSVPNLDTIKIVKVEGKNQKVLISGQNILPKNYLNQTTSILSKILKIQKGQTQKNKRKRGRPKKIINLANPHNNCSFNKLHLQNGAQQINQLPIIEQLNLHSEDNKFRIYPQAQQQRMKHLDFRSQFYEQSDMKMNQMEEEPVRTIENIIIQSVNQINIKRGGANNKKSM